MRGGGQENFFEKNQKIFFSKIDENNVEYHQKKVSIIVALKPAIFYVFLTFELGIATQYKNHFKNTYIFYAFNHVQFKDQKILQNSSF